MNMARSGHDSAFLNGCLYVAGGEKSKERILNSVEK